MKILITSDCYIPTINGVVTSILNLETELRRLGHEVKILCPSQNLQCSESENVYRISSISVNKIYSGARVAFCIHKKRLKSIIDWKPDIIHSQSEFTSFMMAKKIAAVVGCPIVHTYHTVYEDYTHYFSPSASIGRKAVIKLTHNVLSHTEAVIAPSVKIENILKGYGITLPIYVVPTGLKLDKFSAPISRNNINKLKHTLGIPLESRVLITIGRAAKEKNIEELIHYFKRLNAENTVFVIVGDGPYLSALKNIAQKEEIDDKIIFVGAVKHSDIAKYYKLGDVFISASQSETQGLTYIEALASGLPLVCRKDECLDGVILDGKNGIQYNDFDDFKEWISRILDNDTLRLSMSENALSTAQNYSSAAFAENIEKIYASAVEFADAQRLTI